METYILYSITFLLLMFCQKTMVGDREALPLEMLIQLMMVTEPREKEWEGRNVLSLVETRMSPVTVGFQAKHKSAPFNALRFFTPTC